MTTILHITPGSRWRAAHDAGRYVSESLRTQGYIHCSTPRQVVAVANGLFRGREDLVLLVIDEDRLSAEVRYENCEGGEALFPHVYGPIDLDAVAAVLPFPSRPDGTYALPAEVDA